MTVYVDNFRARCEHCSKKIAWSRKRRQWLALAPRTEMPGKPIHRRLHCAPANGLYHDPGVSVLDRVRAFLAGAR